MSNPYIVDRALPERSRLIFYFPKKENRTYKILMPFFENPSIKERKRARYKKHSLISRSSNLYTYHGADSRELNLSFQFTVPHLLEEHSQLLINSFIPGKYETFNFGDRGPRLLGRSELASIQSDEENNYILHLAEKYRNLDSVKYSAKKNIKGVFGNDPLQPIDLDEINLDSVDVTNTTFQEGIFPNGNTRRTKQKNNTLQTIMFWINLIRTSVTNNTQNPIYGPPIIRLFHGPLYMNVPCICTDYNIEIIENSGYDVQTLMPRQIKVNMTLEEFRVGDFETYNSDSYNQTERDNLAGWEAIIKEGNRTTDPMEVPGAKVSPYQNQPRSNI